MEVSRHFFLKAHNICTVCGIDKPMVSSTVCPSCAEKRAERDRKLHSTEEWKAKDREFHKKLYERRKAQGLCPKCGKPAIPGKSQCLECNLKRRKRYLKKELKSNLTKREAKEYFNMCRCCGKDKPIEGKKLCKSCYEIALKNINHAKQYIDLKNHIFRVLANNSFKVFKAKTNYQYIQIKR